MIIDSHVHLLIYEEKAKSLEEVLSQLILGMGKNRIDYAIVIPDNLENLPDGADLNRCRELIKGHDNLFLLGSPQIIQRGSSEIDKYKSLLTDKVIQGIKLFPGHDPYIPTDDRCQPYYELLQELDYPVVFHTGEVSCDPNITNPLDYNDPKHIVEVAKKYPRLKVVISHYYWPKIDYCYEITKDIPNIYFELAATADPEVVKATGGDIKIREILRKTIKDRPRQVLFGTDWPMSMVENHIQMVKSLELSDEVSDLILFKNAIEVYKLPITVKLQK